MERRRLPSSHDSHTEVRLCAGTLIDSAQYPSPIIAQHTPPFAPNDPIRLYIVLTGRMEVYRGALLLKEAMEMLVDFDYSSLVDFLPWKECVISAGGAWGGPSLLLDSTSEKLLKLKERIAKEVNLEK